MADPFTAHLLSDLVRVATAAGAVALSFLTLRLVWLRLRAPAEDPARHAHPATVLSYCLLLVMLIERCFGALGSPADGWLFGQAAAVCIGYYGVLQRLRFSLTPPWRR